MKGSGTRAREGTSAAREAWRAMFDLFFSLRAHERVSRACGAVGLSPAAMKLLAHLEPGEGIPMRDLAEHWGYDPSYVTSLTDALEERGLVERRPHPGDRRVKMIALTPEGVAARDRVAELLYEPPASFDALTRSEARQLRDLLRKVIAAEPGSASSRAGETTRPR